MKLKRRCQEFVQYMAALPTMSEPLVLPVEGIELAANCFRLTGFGRA
jgi:hypothetical protein